MYVINPKARGEYTLARDAILRGAQITYNGLCPLITYQSFGLDKKLSNPIGLLNFLEAPPRIELGDKGFADLCLTAWLWCRNMAFSPYKDMKKKKVKSINTLGGSFTFHREHVHLLQE